MYIYYIVVNVIEKRNLDIKAKKTYGANNTYFTIKENIGLKLFTSVMNGQNDYSTFLNYWRYFFKK